MHINELDRTHGRDFADSVNGRAVRRPSKGEEGKENNERAHDSNESGCEGVSLCIGCVGDMPWPGLQSERRGERDDEARWQRDPP